ncbi:Hypothetical_protein [Hexamita inflata]|uniref:Hypothetical_protein n=1 Tax=Hexamita inflata TaxID=28002 RepID=A0AA86U5L3_9EUKA|nr:Hypothetical protein HINF_LOCUS29459 [Hexamita inflata]
MKQLRKRNSSSRVGNDLSLNDLSLSLNSSITKDNCHIVLVALTVLKLTLNNSANLALTVEKRCSDEQKFEVFKILNDKVVKRVRFRPNQNCQSQDENYCFYIF